MPKNMRNVPGNVVQDPSAIENLQYNDAAGSKKVSEVGRHLHPIPYLLVGVLSYTTDAATARVMPRKGVNVAVYNNAGAVGALTMGASAAEVAVALAPGVTDASGHVGIPCPPNAWTYIALAEHNWIITTAATLLVFIIDDNSSIKELVK